MATRVASAALLTLLAGCNTRDGAPRASTDAAPAATFAPTPLPAAAAPTPAAARRDSPATSSEEPGAADGTALVDLRDPPADDPVDDGTARSMLAALYPDGPPASAMVVDAAAGDFLGTGTRQRAWLVLPDGARAAQPDAMRALLVIDDGRGSPRRVPLASPYLAIDAVTRLAGEPGDVLLLRIAGLQMGHRFAAIHAVAVRDGTARIVERFPAALASGCGTTPEATARAAAILLVDGRLQRRDYVAPCPADGEPGPAVWTPAPPDAG